MSGSYKSIAEIKAANEALGESWFSRGAMAFFGTVVHANLIDGRLFITSDRVLDEGERRFSVREALPDGSISTVGGFMDWPNKSFAVAAAWHYKATGEPLQPREDTP